MGRSEEQECDRTESLMVEAIMVILIPAFFAFITKIATDQIRNARSDVEWLRNQVVPVLERQTDLLEKLTKGPDDGHN